MGTHCFDSNTNPLFSNINSRDRSLNRRSLPAVRRNRWYCLMSVADVPHVARASKVALSMMTSNGPKSVVVVVVVSRSTCEKHWRAYGNRFCMKSITGWQQSTACKLLVNPSSNRRKGQFECPQPAIKMRSLCDSTAVHNENNWEQSLYQSAVFSQSFEQPSLTF